jgi:hypothetical protein
MENLRIEQLIKLDSPTLTSVIDNWKDYDKTKVIISIIELKFRSYELNKNILNKLENFCKNYDINDLDNETIKIIRDNGFADYLEYRKNIIEINNKSESEFYIIESPNKILKAGKSLKIVVYSYMILMACSITGILIVINTNNAETIRNTYITIGFVSFLLNIIILVSLFEAGDNLENSVKINSGDKNEKISKTKLPSF